MSLILFVPSFVLPRFSTSQLIFWCLFLTLSLFLFSCRGYNEIWELTHCMRSPFPIAFLVRPLYYFSRFLFAFLISESGTTGFALPVVMGCRGIALISPSTVSWATMDTASGPGVRGTFFTAIPQSIKISNRSLISQPGILALPAVMGSTEIALLW